MADKKNSISYIFTVALLLCIACSVVVSTASVLLRPIQQVNQALDFKRNVLAAAGLLQPGVDVEEQFARIDVRIVDLRTGRFTDEINPADFSQRVAARDPNMSDRLSRQEDIAGIGRLEHYAEVYLATDESGQEILILPVRGYGLWSTMLGFIALESDFNTVVGLGFYDHGETPGLGGEIDNPRWQRIWEGKQLFDDQGQVALQVIKGAVDPDTRYAEHRVDGLSGATLTGRGVTNMIQFWFSDRAFGQFIENLRRGEA